MVRICDTAGYSSTGRALIPGALTGSFPLSGLVDAHTLHLVKYRVVRLIHRVPPIHIPCDKERRLALSQDLSLRYMI